MKIPYYVNNLSPAIIKAIRMKKPEEMLDDRTIEECVDVGISSWRTITLECLAW